MTINKLINEHIVIHDWLNESTNVDDIAYYLFISHYEYPSVNQFGFKRKKNEYIKFYIMANKIIRKEKLIKLNEKA